MKIHFFFCLCYWLIEETNAAELYERTKFDLFFKTFITEIQEKEHNAYIIYSQKIWINTSKMFLKSA